MKLRNLTWLAVFLILVSQWAAAEALVQVSRAEGQALIMRGLEKIESRAGAKVQLNDAVETSAGSKVDIVWGGAWGCRLLESSRILITGMEAKDQRMKLEKGGVLLHFKQMPRKSEFQIDTPTAVASVRGTQFMARTWGDGQEVGTTIAVLRGVVSITSKTTELRYKIRAGEALDIPSRGPKDSQRPITAEERALLADTDRIRTHFGEENTGY